MSIAEQLATLTELFNSKSFRYTSEMELQEGLRGVLADAGIPAVKEFRLTPQSRLDFLVWEAVAIEAKLGRSLASLTRQLHRYTLDARVGGVLVVSTRMRLHNLPDVFNNKPVRVCTLLASMF